VCDKEDEVDEERFRGRLRRAGDELEAWSRANFPLGRAVRRGTLARRFAGPAAIAARVGVATAVVVLAVQFLPGTAGRPTPVTPGTPGPVATDLDSPSPAPSPRSSGTPTMRPTPVSSEQATSRPKETPPAPVKCQPPEAATQTPSGVTVTLSLGDMSPRESAPAPMDMTIKLRNDGLTPLDMWRGTYHYDFWVTDSRGVVWRWSHEKVFTQPLIHETLAPGQELERTETWDKTTCGGETALPFGRYVARAFWKTYNDSKLSETRYWWSNPVAFEIG
jgi:intracellular proteinase inhibitor BsuPI